MGEAILQSLLNPSASESCHWESQHTDEHVHICTYTQARPMSDWDSRLTTNDALSMSLPSSPKCIQT